MGGPEARFALGAQTLAGVTAVDPARAQTLGISLEVAADGGEGVWVVDGVFTGGRLVYDVSELLAVVHIRRNAVRQGIPGPDKIAGHIRILVPGHVDLAGEELPTDLGVPVQPVHHIRYRITRSQPVKGGIVTVSGQIIFTCSW